MRLSIIIPCKNEERRLPDFLKVIAEFVAGQPHEFEIIVVDDGSSDHTSAVVSEMAGQFSSLKVIRHEVNHGKGYAVKTGMMQAQGDILLFLDADGSTHPREIVRGLFFFDEGFDIVIGSRAMPRQQERIKAKWYRRLMGRVFGFCVNAILSLDIHDTQCGFKMFRRDVARDIFSRIRLDGFAFDLEVLYLAGQMGLRIKEMAIGWEHRAGSKVGLLNDSLRMFFNILQVRAWHGCAKGQVR